MKFAIRTELHDEHELTSSNEIEWAVDRLANEPGSFLCIEPEAAVNEITYIQACYIEKTKGLFRKKIIASYYEIEVQKEKPNGDLYQYFYDTEDFHDALRIICDFYESMDIADLAGWQCELFYKAKN